MQFSLAALLVAASASFASAQSGNTTVTINPGSVSDSLKQTWCRGQRNTCIQLCGGPSKLGKNDCDLTMLTSTCSCSDNSNPPIADYAQSLQAHVCEEYVSQCVNNAAGDGNVIDGCRATICGNKTVDDSQTTGASSSGSPSSSPTGSGAPPASSSPNAAAILGHYGPGLFAAGLFAVFGVAL